MAFSRNFRRLLFTFLPSSSGAPSFSRPAQTCQTSHFSYWLVENPSTLYRFHVAEVELAPLSPPQFRGDVGRGPLHAAISATSLRRRTAIHFLAARSLRRQLSAIRDQFFVSKTENFVKTSSKRRHFTPVASIERAPDRVDRRASS